MGFNLAMHAGGGQRPPERVYRAGVFLKRTKLRVTPRRSGRLLNGRESVGDVVSSRGHPGGAVSCLGAAASSCALSFFFRLSRPASMSPAYVPPAKLADGIGEVAVELAPGCIWKASGPCARKPPHPIFRDIRKADNVGTISHRASGQVPLVTVTPIFCLSAPTSEWSLRRI